MGIKGLSFEEIKEPKEVLALSEKDADTIFPDIEYQIEEAGQCWFFILLDGVRVGYYSTIWPNKPEIYQFFICPNARRKGVGLVVN